MAVHMLTSSGRHSKQMCTSIPLRGQGKIEGSRLSSSVQFRASVSTPDGHFTSYTAFNCFHKVWTPRESNPWRGSKVRPPACRTAVLASQVPAAWREMRPRMDGSAQRCSRAAALASGPLLDALPAGHAPQTPCADSRHLATQRYPLPGGCVSV